MEKLKNNVFVQNICRYKKIAVRAVLVCALFAGICAAAEEAAEHYFNVDGVVTAIDDNTVTVSNKLYDRQVDFTGSVFSASALQIGEKVKIDKNLQGTILSIKKDYRYNLLLPAENRKY